MGSARPKFRRVSISDIARYAGVERPAVSRWKAKGDLQNDACELKRLMPVLAERPEWAVQDEESTREFGVFGRCDSADGAGVGGRSEAGVDPASGSGGVGVIGTSQAGDGVVGGSDANVKSGVFGFLITHDLQPI